MALIDTMQTHPTNLQPALVQFESSLIPFGAAVVRRARHLGSYFFFKDTATTEIYTLSLHDALPISALNQAQGFCENSAAIGVRTRSVPEIGRAHGLNSSHDQISYAVFCLKKKKKSMQVYYLKKKKKKNNTKYKHI